jgi:hypothetical protein
VTLHPGAGDTAAVRNAADTAAATVTAKRRPKVDFSKSCVTD